MRIDSRTADVASIGDLRITAMDGFSTELRNVANVYLGGKEAEEIVRLNGRRAAGLQVYKQSSANIATTVDTLKPIVEQLNAELPAGYHLEVAVDRSLAVRTTGAGVQEELLLAVAILVDDSVVVLESIFDRLEHGDEPKGAAIRGRNEIGMAAIAITMVDVAVWGPILLVTDTTGAFLRNFAIVVIASTLASLVVSFTLTPLTASRWLGEAGDRSLLARIAAFWEPAYKLLEAAYRVALHSSLRHRPVVVVGAPLIFASNLVILPQIGTEFIPESNDEVVSVVGELPPGTALEAADRVVRRWETAILDHARYPEIHTAYLLVGQGASDAERAPETGRSPRGWWSPRRR